MASEPPAGSLFPPYGHSKRGKGKNKLPFYWSPHTRSLSLSLTHLRRDRYKLTTPYMYKSPPSIQGIQRQRLQEGGYDSMSSRPRRGWLFLSVCTFSSARVCTSPWRVRAGGQEGVPPSPADDGHCRPVVSREEETLPSAPLLLSSLLFAPKSKDRASEWKQKGGKNGRGASRQSERESGKASHRFFREKEEERCARNVILRHCLEPRPRIRESISSHHLALDRCQREEDEEMRG